jgi:hypothetical protein
MASIKPILKTAEKRSKEVEARKQLEILEVKDSATIDHLQVQGID